MEKYNIIHSTYVRYKTIAKTVLPDIIKFVCKFEYLLGFI